MNNIRNVAGKVLLFGFGIICGGIIGFSIATQNNAKENESKVIVSLPEQMGFQEFEETKLSDLYLADLYVDASKKLLIVTSENKIMYKEALIEYYKSILDKIPSNSEYNYCKETYIQAIKECETMLEDDKSDYERVKKIISNMDDLREVMEWKLEENSSI